MAMETDKARRCRRQHECDRSSLTALVYLGVIAVLAVGFVWMPISAAEEQHDHSKHASQTPTASANVNHGSNKSGDSRKCQDSHQSRIKGLGEALAAIDAAKKAIDAGNKDKGIEHLAKARKLVAASHKVALAAVGIANNLCPIMGSKLDPSKVPAGLTRAFEGKKIGFCCKGCPVKWDKLSDAQRKEKLSKSKPGHDNPQRLHSMKKSDCC